MDMEFSEEQQQLMGTARKFLQKECPLRLVRELETSELGFSRDLWRSMAELGWLGLPYPQEYGGYEMGSVDLVVLAKELGRALCPSPYTPTVVLSGGAIAAAGTEEQKRAYLPRIAAGETIIAFALQESNTHYDPRGIAIRATEAGDGFVLSGTKMFVEFAQAADHLLVVARTAGEPPSSDGLTMFLVDAKSRGIQLTSLDTVARDRQFRVTLDQVTVSKEDVLGPVGQAWPLLESVIHRGVVALCGYMVGAAEQIHQMATDFAKERVQFDRPIGSFQAIQHYLAQTITEIIAADTTTFYAAWALDEGLPAREIVAKAKAFAGDTFKQASAIGAQIHGGIGFNEDVDTTLFLRRGKQYQLSMGDTGYWEDIIAEEILDT
jgi:alkylation response protein AidB-like acyl-CoA dehydrogenase